ncbi:hypothetical protein FRC12_001393 [Ceratobasidium sp. 428]|nr:hypothetical protein FRC12_001393 [Ceratobasidium sp. 428]
MANDEYRGYKPNLYYSDEADVEAVTSVEDDPSADDNGGPDVIPIQYLGVMDSDQSKVPSDELMGWGINNMLRYTENTRKPGYAIRHGAAPVSTFGQPPAGEGPADPNRDNFWEATFPGLHPRGLGGIERNRPAPLSLNDHGRWLLDYHDRRFHIHHSFPFVLFSTQQRCQGLLSTKLQMNQFNFDRIAHTLDTITPADLRRAAKEESRGELTSNPAIQELKRSITATSRQVMASGASHTQLRSQIQSAAIYFNQPTIWLTINPDDLHDPIAQIFAGEEIDMDNFIRTAGPDSTQRAQNIAQDPYAAAKFFHFTVTLVLENLFSMTTS